MFLDFLKKIFGGDKAASTPVEENPIAEQTTEQTAEQVITEPKTEEQSSVEPETEENQTQSAE